MASIFNSYFNGDDGDDTDNDDDGDGDGDAQCGSKQWVVAGGAAVFESECKAQTFIPGLCYSGYCISMILVRAQRQESASMVFLNSSPKSHPLRRFNQLN